MAAAVAVGALTVAGFRLAAPELLAVDDPLDALVGSTTLGLASLRIPLTAGEATAVVPPLSGAAAVVWAVATVTRRRRDGSQGSPQLWAGAAGAALGTVSVLLAWATGGADVRASLPGAALAGLVWGAGGALLGSLEPPPRDALLRTPSFVLLGSGAALAAAWLAAAGLFAVATGKLDLSGLLGAVLLAGAFAPNLLAGLVALGSGGRADLALSSDGSGVESAGSVALWDWTGGGIAPWYFVVLVAVPLAATAGAALVPPGPSLRRGLRNGLVLGGTVGAVCWAGGYELTTGPGAAAIRIGVAPPAAFALGVVWGLAGSLVASAISRVRSGSRVTP